MDLTDEQWRLIEPLIPVPLRRADGRGRPRCNPREVMNGILRVMRTGAAWADIPSRYPSSSTCHRYFQAWVSVRPDSELPSGGFVYTWPDRLGRVLYRRHVRASQKGALPSAKPNAAKGASSWQFLAFLSPFTYRVLRRMNPSSLSHAYFVADEPKRLIGDKAYDFGCCTG